MTEQKQIATLPPIEELRADVPRSLRTGEPRRPLSVLLAAVVSYLAVAACAGVYGYHWWLAAHPDSYARSARLIEWVDPDPGKWLSLALEGAFAAAAVLAAGSIGVAGFQAWNGWPWSKWMALIAVALLGGFAAIFSNWGFVALGLGVVAALLLFLPPTSRYFQLWRRVRSERAVPYRRPRQIHYGRLARYR